MSKFTIGFVVGALAMLVFTVLYDLYHSLGETDGNH